MTQSFARILGAIIAGTAFVSVSAADPVLAPAPAPWSLKRVSESKDISGIACQDFGAFQRCVIAIDEGDQASIATLKGTEIVQDALAALPLPKDTELDAEGVTFDPETKFFYLVGSHGAKRHCCEDNPSAFNLMRFRLSDAATASANPIAGSVDVAKSLTPALKASAQIGPHAGLCLGTKPTDKEIEKGCKVTRKQGANVEGIAIHKGNLYLGFRGPVHGRTAYLMRFDAKQMFEAEPAATTIPIELKSPETIAIGIRDLAAVATGLLILTGPEDDEPGRAALFHFDPDSRAIKRLGALTGLADKAKPEALLVLEDSPQRYRVLVISDGIKNGMPAEYLIGK
jgi:hypothetical protein